MVVLRSILIIISIGLVSGCAFLEPDRYDPAVFDSRDYYALDQGAADDSIYGMPGLSIGFGSSWPVFGALSPYSSNIISPGYSSVFSGSSFSSHNLYRTRNSFFPGISHNPIPPVMTGFADPGRAVPPVIISPGSRAYHYGEDGRIYQKRGASRIGRSSAGATRRHASLSRSYSMRGRHGGLTGGHTRRAGRGRGRAIH